MKARRRHPLVWEQFLLSGHTVVVTVALHAPAVGQVGVWLLHETVPAGCVLSRLKIELPDPSVRHEPASSSTDLGPVWGKSDAGGHCLTGVADLAPSS